jgi:NADH dehydrogenase
VVVVGAGFGGLATVKGLRRADVDVTLIDRHNYHLFQPLLYQVASALLDPSDIAHPVRSILRGVPNCDFRLATVTGVDFQQRIVHTSTGDLGYEHLVLATGSATSYFGNQALAGRAYGLKDLGEALALRARVLGVFEQASRTAVPDEPRALLTFVIVGAGPTGVEYAGALSELVHHVLKRDFPSIDVKGVDIVLVEAVGTVLSAFAAGLGRRAEAALRGKRVRILFEHMVSEVREGEVVFASGERLAAATMIWTAGVAAEAPGGMAGVERAAQDRIRVSPGSLEVIGHPAVFAIGDVAACAGPGGRLLPMVAPVAIQQGDQVARVIAARTRGEADPPPFHYRDRGSMATVGRNAAVAQIGPLRLSGFIGWMAWLFVHLMSLVSFRNRLLVLIGWAWNYFFYDRPVRLIVSPTPPSEIAGGPPILP